MPLVILLLGAGIAVQVSHTAAVESAETELIHGAGQHAALLTARMEQIGGLVAGASAHWSQTDHEPAAVTGQELREYITATGDGENFTSLTTGLVYILRASDADLEAFVALRRESQPDFQIGELAGGSQHALVWAQSDDEFPLGSAWNANEARRDQLALVSTDDRVLVSTPVQSEGGRTVLDVVGPVNGEGGGLPVAWIGTEVDLQDLMIESTDGSERIRWTMREGDVVLGQAGPRIESSVPTLGYTRGIEMLGRPWQLTGIITQPTVDLGLLLNGLLLAFTIAATTLLLSRSAVRYRESAKTAERDRSRYESFAGTVLESIDIGIVAVDDRGRITMNNEAANRMYDTDLETGWTLKEWATLGGLRDAGGTDLPPDQLPLVQALRGETVTDLVVSFTVKDQNRFHLVSARPLHDPERGTILGAVASVSDITDRKTTSDEMTRLAMHDHLTGLPNRRKLHEVLDLALQSQRGGGDQVTLLFMDLDRFKEVNDALGHHRGDQMLIDISNRLQDFTHGDDLVARIGGDEFVLLCPHQPTAASALTLAREAAASVTPVLSARGDNIRCGVSVGVVRPEDSATVDDVLRHADLAMYEAKADAKKSILVYEPELDARAAANRKMAHDLRNAIDQDRLSVAFQPLISADSLETVGMEALVRWEHDGEMRSPGAFLPIAEKSDLIVDLDLWVLRAACRTAALPGMPSKVNVNLGARTLALDDLVQRVCEAMDAAGIGPENLCLELTETSLIGASEVMDRSLQTLSDMGITLALDDFGTGYASLNYLRRFPVDVVKIDRSFVDGMTTNDDDRAIVSGSVMLARSLGLSTVAEGVETEEQRDLLVELGCDRLQGYLFGRPTFPDDWPQQAPADAGQDLMSLVRTPSGPAHN